METEEHVMVTEGIAMGTENIVMGRVGDLVETEEIVIGIE